VVAHRCDGVRRKLRVRQHLAARTLRLSTCRSGV